jgi:hypothetical protein
MELVLKTIHSADGTRRLDIVRRDDGAFTFWDYIAVTSLDGNPAWSPDGSSPSPLCASAEIAEREARARVAWLREMSKGSN